MKQSHYKYHATAYFCLTFLITWGAFAVALYMPSIANIPLIYLPLLLIGLMGPFLASLILIFKSTDINLKNTYFKHLFNLKLIKVSSIPLMILVPLLSISIAILISVLFGGSFEQFTLAESFSFHISVMPTVLMLFLAAVFEELGWRGYGMESLSEKFNFFIATFIFAIIWALWHLPLFVIPHTYQANVLHLNFWYAVNFMFSMIPLAFIISWLWKINNCSIPAAIFLHFIINIIQELFMVTQQTKCIQSFVLLLFAIIIIMTNKSMFFVKAKDDC